MEVFTYNDYITCIHTLRLKSASKLAEESEKYNLEINTQKKRENNIHNEMIKEILKKKNEVAEIINDFISTDEKLKGKDLEKHTRKKYKQNDDIIYKQKYRNVFFLIRHQQKVDNNMLYEVLKSCIDIIYNWNINIKIKDDIKYPVVVPIIIYTGTKKWNITCNFSDIQVNDYRFKNCKLDFKYNLIDISKLSVENLIQKNSLFSYAMALGKTRNHEQFINILNKELISSRGKKVLQRKFINNLLQGLEKQTKDKEIQEKVEDIKKELVEFLIKESIPEEKRLKF